MIKNYKKKSAYLVIELLEAFTKKELDSLKRFTLSPYFNTDKYVIKLLDVLIKKILHQSIDNNIIHFKIFNKVFVNLPKASITLNKKQKALLNAKMSALTKLAERFLTVEALESSDKNRCELLLDALFEKKQFRLHQKHLKKEATLLSGNQIDVEYFDLRHLLEDHKFQYIHFSRKYIKEDNLNEVTRSLDLSYLSKKLTYTLTGLSYNNVKAHKKYDQSVMVLIEGGFFDHTNYKKYPLLVLNIANAKLMMEETLEAYHNLIKLIDKHEANISKNYLNVFYGVLVNFCIRQTKKGRSEYFSNYVELTKKMDLKNILFVANSFPIQKLKNIVTIGCRVKEFGWVIEMIEKCTPYISQKIRTDVVSYNLGYVAFQKKEYDTCIDYLIEVSNFNIRYDMEKRFLLLKAYYELDKHYLEPTAQVFRSIEIFVLRNKLINTKDKKYHKNFVNLAYNLYRYKHRVGKMDLSQLKDKFESATLISNKAWLKEKIEELENRKKYA